MGRQFTVSLTPQTSLGGPELQDLCSYPMFLEIILSCRLDTTRVAAVTRGVRDPNMEKGESNHMGVF